MKNLKISILALGAFAILLPFMVMEGKTASNQPSMFSKSCLNCHAELKDMKDTLAGNFKSRSNKAKSIQVKINNRFEMVKFTPETEVENVPSMKSLKGTIPLRIHYKKVGNDLVATKIVAKPKMEVTEEQLMDVEELTKLVAQGPEKGGYMLVDSRPDIKYAAGHIPGAVSIPFPKMQKMKDKLPQDKSKKLIFYCEGFR